MSKTISKNNIKNGLLATAGFMLSPLSWWNDLIINAPLAYIFSLPFSLINESLFIPGFILGYWLTNILGFLLLHKGLKNLLTKSNSYNLPKVLFISLFYTLVIVLIAYLGWIQSPAAYLNHPG